LIDLEGVLFKVLLYNYLHRYIKIQDVGKGAELWRQQGFKNSTINKKIDENSKNSWKNNFHR